jgi:hypothetical protein
VIFELPTNTTSQKILLQLLDVVSNARDKN